MSKSQVKYSIITIATNAIALTTQCIESILKYTKDFEIIVINNNSNDGTEGYLNSLNLPNMKIIRVKNRLSFSQCNNLGLQVADGEYIIFLNNDTIVSEGWLDKMEKHLTNVPLSNIAAVGPVSSNSNGVQMVGKQNAKEWYEKHKGAWKHVGCLYGWCIMIKASVLEEIGGFDETLVNSYEDNDLCLRIQLAGYKMVVAYDTYIDHLGQGTLRNMFDSDQYYQNGVKNRERYFDKWYDSSPKKLVAVYRTSGGKHLEKSLAQTSKFADKIILHLCRARSNFPVGRLEKILNDYPQICKYEFYDGAFQEDYERNWLLQEALKLQEQGEADWCISIDDDEIYEDKFIERVQKYMNPPNPEILGYICNWRTIWREEMGSKYFRKDSTFGKFMNYRFFRLIPGQEITSIHPEGHHCGSAPILADNNLQWIAIRVEHLGYDTPEQRQKKFEFYEANDHFKTKRDIGYDDYSHLIDRNVLLEEYEANNGISCNMMVKNEKADILPCLEGVMYLVDQYVIVDTGSTDGTREIIQKFAERSPVPVILVDKKWNDIYAIPRNYGKDLCTQRWILHLDADERFSTQDIPYVFELSESENDAWIFHVYNYLENPRVIINAKHASSESVRLFKNIKDFYYTGLIHETLDDSLRYLSSRRKIKVDRVKSFPLHHFGYLKKKDRVREKLDYYEKLNLAQAELSEGKDPRPYMNLALHYINDNKDADAVKMFRKCIDLNPNFHLAKSQLAAMNIKSAKKLLYEAATTMPLDHPFRNKAIDIYQDLEKHDFGAVKVT